MRVVLVGERDGRGVVRWPQVVGLGFVLSMILGLGMGSVYYMLAGRWSHFPALMGIAWGVTLVGWGVVRGLATPPDKLTRLDS